ncbi:outer membrane protein assembly factor BamB family protein [Halosimplex amylolyticum]|uniref:outer membrane protein assembly factor BamB family protein n=1 Tax=Halosimplex amylolyticum TaxID=3396616 RepID=UPI003F545A90
MDRGTTRRQVLRIGGIGCAIGASGCLGPLSSSDGDGGGGGPLSGGGGPNGWPRVQRDAAATGQAGGSGPTSSVEEVWTASTDDGLGVTPAVVDGTAYVESPSGVAALDAETGDEQWNTGLDSTPAYLTVLDGTLYFEAGGMRALDVSDGSEEWTYDAIPEKGYPTVVDGTAYVGKATGGLVAVDASNGEESWSFPFDKEVRAPPAVANGSVYVTTLPTDDEQGDLIAVDAESGEENWRSEGGVFQAQTPTVVDGSVYLQERYVTARSADGGDEEWVYDDNNTAIVPRSVAVADGTVYFGSKRPGSTSTTVFAVDAESGDLDWDRSFDGGAVDAPILSDGTVYLGTTEGTVYGLDAASGETRWEHSVDGGVDTGLALADGQLYAVSDEGTLHVLAEA